MNHGIVARILVLAALLASPARAQERARVVEIRVEGGPAAVEQVRVVADELLAEVAVRAVVRGGEEPFVPEPNAEQPFVRAYFDLGTTPASLVIFDGATAREIEHRTLSPRASLEASVESATHVLLMVVESKLDERGVASEPSGGTSRGSEPAPDARPSPPPAESARPPLAFAPPPNGRDELTGASTRHTKTPSALALELGAMARGLYLGDGHLVPGAGATLDFDFERTTPLLGLTWFFAAHAPLGLSSGGATAKLSPFSCGITPALRTRFGTNVEGSFAIGFGLTWFSLTSEGPTGVRLGRSTGGVDPTIIGALGLRIRASARWSLFVNGAFEADLAPREFVALEGGERHVLASFPALRPFVTLGGAYTLFGTRAGWEND